MYSDDQIPSKFRGIMYEGYTPDAEMYVGINI
jgi:hypothetical protein